jgi:HD-like signal output (HDOD) protein
MKRILFVDDEPMILAGLQNLLRKQRKQWDMEFVESGEKALAKMAEGPFDVIVSDMRMPRMDGATLLKEVQRSYPNVVRIVLSGHAELETAPRSVSVAHQFLAKPCDAISLQNVVDRACSLQALLSDDAIRRAVGPIGKLPSAPKVYLAVTKALEDPDTSMKDLAKLIEGDMAISAKVLQLVNSAFFGLPQRVAGVQQAVSYLGANMIRRVLLSVETFSMFDEEKAAGPFSLEALQAHSNVVAAVASKLLTDPIRSADAFMAGMLHDVGKLILAVHVPEHFKRAMALGRERNLPLYVAEQELFGVTHGEVGAYLLGMWGLPYAIVEAVAHHHTPNRVEHAAFDILDAVYVAEMLVSEASTSSRPALGALHFDGAYLQAFGLESKLPAWRATVSQVMSSTGTG